MSLIEWNDAALSVGIERIDNEHKILVKCINDLSDCIQNKASNDFLTILFDQLISYTQYHFASEESYFKHLNQQDLLLHQLQHKHFIEQLNTYKEQVNHHVTDDLLDFLLDWIISHIQCEDMKFIQNNKK